MSLMTALNALMALFPFFLLSLAAPMDPNRNAEHIEWPSELSSIFSSSQHSHSSSRHEPWNTFASMNLIDQPHQGHDYRQQHYDQAQHHLEGSSSSSHYYPFPADHQIMQIPSSPPPVHELDHFGVGFENESNSWPSQKVYHDAELPSIPHDFNYDILEHFDSPQRDNEDKLEAPSEEQDATIHANVKKGKQYRRPKKTGGWRDEFQNPSEVRDRLMDATGFTRQTVAKALTKKGSAEVALHVLSNEPERMDKALQMLGWERAGRKPRRYDYLGEMTKSITKAYAIKAGVSNDTAALHLNEGIDEHSANLLLDSATFDEGVRQILSTRHFMPMIPGFHYFQGQDQGIPAGHFTFEYGGSTGPNFV